MNPEASRNFERTKEVAQSDYIKIPETEINSLIPKKLALSIANSNRIDQHDHYPRVILKQIISDLQEVIAWSEAEDVKGKMEALKKALEVNWRVTWGSRLSSSDYEELDLDGNERPFDFLPGDVLQIDLARNTQDNDIYLLAKFEQSDRHAPRYLNQKIDELVEHPESLKLSHDDDYLHYYSPT